MKFKESILNFLIQAGCLSYWDGNVNVEIYANKVTSIDIAIPHTSLRIEVMARNQLECVYQRPAEEKAGPAKSLFWQWLQ